ncbi:MAG: DEAD/DEAH box helicase [Methylococcales bacterium]|jgi:superfamily II DNA/RNA helicase/predicted RecB family nuclease|nr:DEAD/DEAH box helicase [Methylococcales bacterium]
MNRQKDSPLLQLPNTFRAFYGEFLHLTSIQKQSIQPILHGKDLIIQAATGAGKTEAVLAPSLERMLQSKQHFSIMYIIPTRALATDLNRRLKPAFERLGLTLGIRTGDFKRGGKFPDAILTTPESFDVMLGSRQALVQQFLARLKIIIIDEVHSLLHRYRGQQLVFCLQRLSRRHQQIQKIALSATIENPEHITQFFSFSPQSIYLKQSTTRQIVPHLVHIKNDENEFIAFINDLYQRYQNRKILIFANSRRHCDQLFALLNEASQFKNCCGLHYSNLQAESRQLVEQQFRQRQQALCISTSTLELGIDIGDVDCVILFEPPDSVSAFLQRIGRSNRRQQHNSFWGICRGNQAQSQLLRFMSLINLARQGRIEKVPENSFPSVVVQQTISCLYEKKQLSLASMQNLLPQQNDLLSQFWQELNHFGWLKETEIKGLFSGGWRFYDALKKQHIWNNFPPNEVDFDLQLDEKIIANIPRSIVDQFKVGDQVRLAGKQLQILEIINNDNEKRIITKTTSLNNEKELFWLGAGFRVSYEVAQEMQNLLSNKQLNTEDYGLFARTRILLEQQQQQRTVTLANGIQVCRLANGCYSYWTFLGALGNAIMKWLIEDTHDEVKITVHDFGFESIDWIDFQTLPYPMDFSDFQQWARRNFKKLLALFSLNAFSHYLPRDLMIQEITYFLFDDRLIQQFEHYQQQTNEIIKGDKQWLFWDEISSSNAFDIVLTSHAENFLQQEKNNNIDQNIIPVIPDKLEIDQNKPLTAKRLSYYFYHQQCQRWLTYQWLSDDTITRKSPLINNELKQHRLAKKQTFEQQVFDQLANKHTLIYCELALSEQLSLLQPYFKNDNNHRVFLVRPILSCNHHNSLKLKGKSIPDLIRVSQKNNTLHLTVGDIRVDHQAQYHHRWQVAYNAWLLPVYLQQQNNTNNYQINTQSFIISRFIDNDSQIKWNGFDHSPYLASLPTLFKNIQQQLQSTSSITNFQIQSHCAQCDYFKPCYQQSLNHDIHYFPQLSPGLLQKFRQQGIQSLDELTEFCQQDQKNVFSPQQYEQIQSKLIALQQNQILLKKPTTRIFPSNLSLTFLVDIQKHPITGYPYHIAFQLMDQRQQLMYEAYWINLTSTQWQKAIQELQQQITRHRRQAEMLEQVSIMIDFNGSSLHWLKQCLDETTQKQSVTNHTSIIQCLTQHFYLPLVGKISLYQLGQLFNVELPINQPLSLWHSDQLVEPLPLDDIKIICQLLSSIWYWIQRQLTSSWSSQGNQSFHYLDFIDTERAYQEEQVLSLQRYPLTERVARFRAIGPLRYKQCKLDDEGLFCYQFEIINPPCISKFRPGDFLKLAPLRTPDIQSGFSIILMNQTTDQVIVRSRGQRIQCKTGQQFSLEEDLTDWNTSKLIHAVKTLENKPQHPLNDLLNGSSQTQMLDDSLWINQWLQQNTIHGLNPMQQQALKLPFQHNLGLIEGPPGTGKTHLLAWTIIALVYRAQSLQQPIRILVSALTHHAIDQILSKVVQIIEQHCLTDFAGNCYKWGGQSALSHQDNSSVKPLEDAQMLSNCQYAILGSTSFGLYQLFDSKQHQFPAFFDWVIFDEASQVLIPQAILALLYGKGHFLFYGDDKQLPPVILGKYPDQPTLKNSILTHLLLKGHADNYRVRLNLSYRMSQALCQFPSQMWYENELKAATENQFHQLELKNFRLTNQLDKIINPQQASTLVLIPHHHCEQQSQAEAEFVCRLTQQLMIKHQLNADQIALISPHRAHNNLVAELLKQILTSDAMLPLIDTIERVQGAERDVIIFSLVSSNPDHFTEFLNNPKRFNVAITRARKKLIVLGSHQFFSLLPDSEEGLINNQCFKNFMGYSEVFSL